jgi:hypothetical protein
MARAAALAAAVAALATTACASFTDAPPPAAQKAVPALVVRIDCGGCEVGASVSEMILESYQARRLLAGARELPDAQATLTIKVFAERGLTTRFLVGPLGLIWSDAIEAELIFDGKRVAVTESTRVPLQGIEAVAKRIGEKSVDALIR